MKRLIILALVVVMAFGWVPMNGTQVSAATAETRNLFMNGSFETTASNSTWLNGVAAANWTRFVFSGTPIFAVDSAVAHIGSKSVRLEASTSARGTVYQQTSVEAGKTYRISGWMKMENVSNKALIRFQVPRTSGASLLINFAEAKGSADWTYYERTITIPNDAKLPATLKIEAFLENSTGKVWFDDFAIEEWIAVQGVALSPAVLSLQPGESAGLTADWKPVDATNRSLTWASSDPAVAKVNSEGVVTAQASGYTLVSATTAEGGFTATAVVSVGASPTLSVSPFTAVADEDSGVEGHLQAADTTGMPITFSKVTDAKHGKATVYPDGRVTYYPDADFSGSDQFTFMAGTASGGPQFAMAMIRVGAVNDAPQLDLKWASTDKNTVLNGRLQDASDADKDTIVWEKAAEPEHGKLQLNADGTYVYTPQIDFVGYDGFRVVAKDGKGGAVEGSMKIFVLPQTGDLMDRFHGQPSYGQHPRLLADKADFDRARSLVQTDSNMNGWFTQLKQESEPILETSPLPYATAGTNNGAIRDRLLRISLMYQLTGDQRYSSRTIQELQAMADYADWGDRTNNILPLAELTHAVSLAYDWVYEAMTPEQRQVIAEAIRVKALGVALDWYHGVFTHNGEYNNINLVDNGNFGMAALAIMDESPASEGAATEVLRGVYRKLQQSLRHYTPDGSWPEGPAYWHYGGQYLTYMMASMNKVLGTDYGLSALDGLEESGSYPQQLLGQNGFFDFYDGGISMAQPESMWYADFYGKPEYAWHLGDLYRRQGVYHPLYLVLYRPGMFDVKPTQLDRFYSAIESGSMRSAWDDPEALFASMKGVKETLRSHNDLDAGTFVFDALGVRWAMDSGNENYSLPGYWDTKYQRWTYYRKKTEGHNTIVVNPAQNPVLQQDPLGTATRIREESKPRGAFTVLDMSNVYRTDAVSMKRGMMLTGDRTQLLVQDEMKLKQPSELYWFMHTKADVEIIENGKAAILKRGDKRLYAKIVEAPVGAVFSVMDAEPLPTSPNPPDQSINFGVRKLTVHLTDVSEANFSVWLVPLYDTEPLPTTAPAFMPLDEWSIPDGTLAPRPVRPTLDGLTVDGVPLADFTPKGTYYEVAVPFETKTPPTVGALGVQPFTVIQATTVPGSGRVTVQDAFDPTLKSTYTIRFNRLPLIGKPSGMEAYPISGVEASAVPEAAQGNTPDRTLDGDLNTRWSASGKQWIRYDLGAIKPVSAVSLGIYNGTTRRAYYDIQSSADGQTWTTLFSGESSGTTLQPETVLLPLTQARYIRILGSGNSSNTYNSITEAVVYGPRAVTEIELDRSAVLLTAAGQQLQLIATVKPEDAWNRNVSWISTDPSVASVDASGLVTATGEGRTTVTAATEMGGFTASAAVTVDLKGPVIQLRGPSAALQSETVTVTVYAADSVTGVSSLAVTLDGASQPASFSIAPLGLSVGEHVIEAVAIDGAGHSTTQIFRLLVEATPDDMEAVLNIGYEHGALRNQGILKSLKAKINHAQSVQSDPVKLAEILRAFENEVSAQTSKGIDADFAKLLLADSAYIRNKTGETKTR